MDVFMYVQNVHDQISIISLWVDDILTASKTEAHLMQIKTRLNSGFKMTDLGQLSWFLGIQLKCENNIKMNQSRYIEDIIKVWHGRLQTTPNSMWNGYNGNEWRSWFNRKSKPYEIISSLIYIIMVATRPDICETITRLSQDRAKPNSFH